MYRLNKHKSSSGARLAEIAVRDEILFHASDLAVLWGISDKNTLYTTLKRYTDKGLLHRIYKGLYSLKSPRELDPYLLGIKAIHGPSYISCETILFNEGIINQPPQAITLVSGISKQFTILDRQYRSRRLADAFLMNDAGIETLKGVRRASVDRAVADMLYFYPKKFFDGERLIPWVQVKAVSDALGYSFAIPKSYASPSR